MLDTLLNYIYANPNAAAFLLLNGFAFAAHRVARVSQTWLLFTVALIGAALGALSDYLDTLAKVGLAPLVLYYAALKGAVIGAGASTLIGWPLSKALDSAGFWPISEAKASTEAIRNPLDPAQPPPKG